MGTARYYDGESAQSQTVNLKIAGGNLLILAEGAGEQLDSWPLKDLRLDPRMPTVPVLMCKHEAEARLELTDTEILESLRELNSSLKKKSMSKKKLGILVSLFVSVLIFIYFGVQLFSAQIARRIPFPIEQKLAKKVNIEKQFDSCVLSLEQTAALDKLVASVYPALPGDSDFSINVQVSREKIANAFTLPGGYILLTQGLLSQAESPEEIAGVLAHELGHVQHRHLLQKIIRGSIMVSLVNFISLGPSGMLLIDPGTAAQLLLLKFDRSMEEEADQAALLRLEEQRIDLKGFQDFFKRSHPELPSGLGFLSTHPGSRERMELIEKNILSEMEAREILTPEEFQALKSVCL